MDFLEPDFEIESESNDGGFSFIEDGDILDQESHLNMIYGIKVNENDTESDDDNFAVEELPDFPDKDNLLSLIYKP